MSHVFWALPKITISGAFKGTFKRLREPILHNTYPYVCQYSSEERMAC